MTRNNLFTAYLGRDAYRNRVFVEVDKEIMTTDAFRSVEHEPLTGFTRLSITGWTIRYRSNTMDSAGQTVDALVGMTEFAEGWTETDVNSLRRIWRQWHLNDMQAACAHMNKREAQKAYASVERPWTMKDADLPPAMICPETGYRYGNAWLVKTVPAEIWAELDRLAALPHGTIVK